MPSWLVKDVSAVISVYFLLLSMHFLLLCAITKQAEDAAAVLNRKMQRLLRERK